MDGYSVITIIILGISVVTGIVVNSGITDSWIWRVSKNEIDLEQTLQELKTLRIENNTLHAKIAMMNQELYVAKSQHKQPPIQQDLSAPIFKKLFKAGWSALIKKAHPDHGGTREEMEEVQEAYEILKNLKSSPTHQGSGLGSSWSYTDSESEIRKAQSHAQAKMRAYDFMKNYKV
ncbi:MAG: hypothetical protein GY800_09125 [Planctomycetes bacterium]|nr:hypothetical protein [Planctomycetota bacterium]